MTGTTFCARSRGAIRPAAILWSAATLTHYPEERALATEDIEFVGEHLAELPMDNRFATLPVWQAAGESASAWSIVAQTGYASTGSGHLEVHGPMVSASVSRKWSSTLAIGALLFVDPLSLTGDADVRPLRTDFSADVPLPLPATAHFDNLEGQVLQFGGGFYLGKTATSKWLGEHRWVTGLIWQQLELRDYRLTYTLLDGAASGVSGEIDFDATYRYVTPFVGLEVPRTWTKWSVSPHMVAAWPFTKHGVVGHITGPGFDIRGNSASAGHGSHIGDPSLTIGFDVTYLPAHLTVDLGTVLTQYLIEPHINKGIETNWLLSCQWRF